MAMISVTQVAGAECVATLTQANASVTGFLELHFHHVLENPVKITWHEIVQSLLQKIVDARREVEYLSGVLA